MRLWPLRAQAFLTAEDETWQQDCWRWFADRMPDAPRALVTPTRDFFPPTEATGHARAEHVFASVKRHARMQDWPCRLVAQPGRPELRVGEFLTLARESGALGTFGAQGNEIVITYDPGLLQDPAALVATLAHELCHYSLAILPEPPPGGADMLEPATDLATVFLGFGLFGASCAFRFGQHGDAFAQGWRMSRQGYLPPRAWCFALALFLLQHGRGIDAVKPQLRPHLLTDTREALAYLRRQPGCLSR